MELPKFIKKTGFYVFARPFVAGETIEDAIQKAKELREKGIYAVINILGEHVKSEQEAGRFRYDYLRLITNLSANGLHEVNIAVKPSQLGIEISEDLYRIHLGQILTIAKYRLPRSLVEIDREEHAFTEAVSKISLDFADSFFNQRLACQMNLKETPKQIQRFIDVGISVRLCKGTAYPGDIKDEAELRKIFLEQALLLSEKGRRPAIATHDPYLIDRLKEKKNLELQVLLGIENKKLKKLVCPERKVGFYVPCGSYWYPYGKRRWKSIVKIIFRNWWYRRQETVLSRFSKEGR